MRNLPGRNFLRGPDGEGNGGGEGGDGNEGADDKNKGGDGEGGEGDGNKGGKGAPGTSLLDLEGNKGERPDYLPEAAWDPEKKAVKPDVLLTEFEKAQKIAKDLRGKLSKGPQQAPKDAKDYKLPVFTEEADKPVGELLKSDDPFIKGLAPIAHKHGLSQTQYEGFVADAARELLKLKPEGEDNKEPTEEELKAHRETELGKLGPSGARIAAAVSGHFAALAKQGHFDDEMLQEIHAMASTAPGIKVLNVMRSLMGGESIPMDGAPVDGLMSDAEIYALYGSEAYNNSQDPGHAAMHEKIEKQLGLRVKAGRPERLQVAS